MSDDPNTDEQKQQEQGEQQPPPPPDATPQNAPPDGGQAAPDGVQSDAEGNVTVPGPKPISRGAQVRLTGEARDAARGGVSSTMEGNVIAKQALEADGLVADGYTPDGTTRTGKPPADTVVTEEGEPIGEVPATGESRVKTEPDVLETEAEKPQQPKE